MKLVVYQEPIPKGRARTVRVNGRTMTFTPKATQEAEAAIRWAITSRGLAFKEDGAISVRMRFSVTKPRSAPKKRTRPITRPDLDNYVKLVLDACNGFLWSDDCHVCRLEAEKVYGDVPSIEIEVEPI